MGYALSAYIQFKEFKTMGAGDRGSDKPNTH